MAAALSAFATVSSSPSCSLRRTLRNLRLFSLFHRASTHCLPSRLAAPTYISARPRVVRASTSVDTDNGSSLTAGGDFDFELITIGAGSGGVRASRFAANFGVKVAVIELPFAAISSDHTGGLGGTCVLRGCVPKKLLVYGSSYSHDFEESQGFGWSFDTEPKHDWPTLITQKNAELRRLLGVYKNILTNAGVTLIEGRGKLVDKHTVEVNGKQYRAKHILLAVGGRATVPDIPGKEMAITSDEALDLPSRPDKIGIVGGGYIALEFASIFNGLGSEVHVFIRGKKVLRGYDEELRDFLAEQMALKGINFHFEESPLSLEKGNDGRLSLKTSKSTEHSFSHIMFGTGRRPNTKNLGLEEAGIALDEKGAIVVDEYSKTNVESIWAVGDCTNRVNLTPVALMEGGAFARTVFGGQDIKPDHINVATAVFTQPPLGSVGLTEEQAVEKYGDVDVFTSNFRPMKATLSGLPDRTFMKLVVDTSTEKVVGAHMCGEDTPEITQGVAVAVKAGLTKGQFDTTVGIHPTAAEELVTMRTPTRKIRKNDAKVPEAEAVKAS